MGPKVSMEPLIRIAALTPALAPAPDSCLRYFKNYLFDLRNRIKIATIYKNIFSNHDFVCKISSSPW